MFNTTELNTAEWYQALARLVEHMGSQEFPRLLADTCEMASPYDSTLITAFREDTRPLQIYHNLPSQHEETSSSPYFAGAYLLDPFYALYQNRAPSSVYRLRDVAPDKFYDSEYYRSYYAHTGLKDEVAILINVDDDLHVLISLGGRDDEHVANKNQLSSLQIITPLLVSICQQHWRLIKDSSTLSRNIDSTLGTPLDLAFRNFGKNYLSTRECEVVQLILKGHSSKSIARLLEISEDTVKVHRKRFHAKLDISSQAELFSLFLESIALVPMGSEEDPLSFYFDGTRTIPTA